MRGPSTKREVRLSTGPARLLWLTGLKARVLDEKGEALSSEFLCHVNLDVDGRAHDKLFGKRPLNAARLMTLSQGLEKTSLPEGFGLPVRSNEPLLLTTQALNLNEPGGRRRVRLEITADWVEDAPQDPLTPLFLVAANVLRCGETGVTPGGMASDGARDGCTPHWRVPPGRQETRSRANHQMELPYDTRAHHILAHAHPFAKWIELYDLTDKKTVFRADVSELKGRLGVENLQVYSSRAGLPLFKDHAYEMAALYDNGTEKDGDAMAVFYLLVEDKGFNRERVLGKLGAR